MFESCRKYQGGGEPGLVSVNSIKEPRSYAMANMITVAGLGPGHYGHLPLSVWDLLRSSQRLFLRTEQHPIVPWLRQQGIKFVTFDYLYEQSQNFQEVYKRIALQVLEEASKGPLVYAVPGHPLVAEESVELILQEASLRGFLIEVIPAMSFLDVLYTCLHLNPASGLYLMDGLNLEGQTPLLEAGNIIIQVYNRLVASDVKLFLMEYYPEDHPVIVVRAAGVPMLERVEKHPLYFLDRLEWIDHLTTLYLPPFPGAEKKCRFPLDPLVNVMSTLRGENGCPWDREQTHQSLSRYLLEEAYEVVEALNQDNVYKMCEELGDLLLQIVFHAQIARENHNFDINEVINGITRKMIKRHPHVFGETVVSNSAEVVVNWEKIKAQDRGLSETSSILSVVPRHLPALLRAEHIQEKAATIGFDWPDYRGSVEKIKEELNELLEAVGNNNTERIQKEVGDLLFSVVNLARLLQVDAEVALTATVQKFTGRFHYIEEKARQAGRELSSCTLEELDTWWEEAKRIQDGQKNQGFFSG